MASERDTVPAGALEDVAYLSRSANRVRILDALAREPHARRELAEVTGVSRTTLDRIVNELEDRGWAERTDDGEYVATPTGDHLVAELRPFLDSVRAIGRLDGAIAWLPDDLSIGLHHFSDATVRRPEGNDPMETADFFVDLARDASEIRVLTHLAPPVPLSTVMRDGIAGGNLSATFVLTDGIVDYLRVKPERRNRWREIVRAGADVYRLGDHIPCNLFVFGGTVLVKRSGPGPIRDAYGTPIVSENGTVRRWARDLIERYRDDATRLDAGTFTGEPTVSRVESDDG